jgi:hypothetical protein
MKNSILIILFSPLFTFAQFMPDRSDYQVESEGNFYTTAHDLKTALAIALNTLDYNGAKMRTINVDRKNIDNPLLNYFHRDSQPDFVYIAYVARTKTGYIIWFKFLPEQFYQFEEEYIILEYEGNN